MRDEPKAIDITLEGILPLLDAITDASLLLHGDGRVCFANPAALSLLGGVDADDVVGLHLSDLFLDLIPRNGTASDFSNALRRLGTDFHRARTALAEAAYSRLQVRAVPLTDDEAGYVAVVVRPHCVPRPLDVLASRVGHELGNLLTPLLGYLELARLQPDIPATIDVKIQTLMQICRRIHSHSQNLLLLKPRSAPMVRTANLQYLVETGIAAAEETGLTQKHRLTFIHDRKTNLQVRAESDLVPRLVSNLVLNAAESMPKPGELVVEIRGAVGGTSELYVSDFGPGIPEEMHDRIFDLFYTTKSSGKGLGLGLYVARMIADRHQATIAFSANRPSGTVVTVGFPAVEP